jgi:DNA-binding IscR family transcriptional regulator
VAAARYTPACGIARAMWDAEQAWRASLGQVTVADLAADAVGQAPAEAVAKGIRWLATVRPGDWG